MHLIDIQQLFEQNKLSEAYAAIQQYTKSHPDDDAGNKLHEKIYKAIEAQNTAKIDNQLEKVTELINNKQFGQALNIALKLKTYAPENQNLLKLISQAYEGHQKTQQTEAKSSWQQFVDQINELRKKHQYKDAIQVLEQAFNKTPDARLQKLNLQIRDELVNYKIETNQKNLDRTTPDKAMRFLDDLQKIAPKHPALPDLRRKYQAKMNQKNSISRKHYIKDAKREIKVLYFQGKFEKSIQACVELIKADPKNRVAKKFYVKNQKAIEVEGHKVAYQKLGEYQEKLKKLSKEQMQLEYIKV